MNNFQIVRIKGFVSAKFPIPSGVPQVTYCGPVLFDIFINDIKVHIRYSRILLYADDIKLFRPILSVHDASKLQ